VEGLLEVIEEMGGQIGRRWGVVEGFFHACFLEVSAGDTGGVVVWG